MSYQVFARKYRPRTFKDVLGQDHVVRTLCNAIEQKRLAHAYLFVGPRGTGKASTARIFAKALNCTGGPSVDFDPDEDVCREIAEGRSLDVLEIDGASNRGIDNIRDLRDNVQFAPTRGKYRIIYIDEVHMLTKESFNALLKTLEEPPAHVMFIFATTEPHKILPTILSRCQRFDLRPIPADIIARHLVNIAANEGVTLSEAAAFAIARVADGGMRDAQSMLDQLVSFCGNDISEQNVNDIFGVTSRDTVVRALAYMLDRQLPSLLHLVHELAEAGRDMGQLLSELMGAVRELLVSKVAPDEATNSLPAEWRETLSSLLARTPTDKIISRGGDLVLVSMGGGDAGNAALPTTAELDDLLDIDAYTVSMLGSARTADGKHISVYTYDFSQTPRFLPLMAPSGGPTLLQSPKGKFAPGPADVTYMGEEQTVFVRTLPEDHLLVRLMNGQGIVVQPDALPDGQTRSFTQLIARIRHLENTDSILKVEQYFRQYMRLENAHGSVVSASRLLGELEAVLSKQTLCRFAFCLGITCIVGILLTALAGMEYRQNEYIYTLMKSFGIHPLMLVGAFLVENIVIVGASFAAAVATFMYCQKLIVAEVLKLGNYSLTLAEILPEIQIISITLLICIAVSSLPIIIAANRDIGRVLK